jgi:hypothetical protein
VAIANLVCLGKFTDHSYEAWRWLVGAQLYSRSCTLAGCNGKEIAPELWPGASNNKYVDRKGHDLFDSPCPHIWGIWESTADQSGVYAPPFAYSRTCSACGARWLAARLVAGSGPS